MGSVAADLKSEREKRKISLAQIAAETRISLRHLESLEEGRFGDLPGGMYNRAFLRAYCEFLNLDLPDVMQRYDAEISPDLEKPPKTKVHIPQQGPSFRISPVVVWGILVLISAAGLFFSRKWITAIFSPYYSHTQVASVRHEPAQPAAPPLATSERQPAAVLPPAAMPASEAPETTPSPTTAALPVQPPQPAVPAASTPVQSGTGTSPAVPSPMPAAAAKALRLEIKATETCWISVNRDGSPVIRKVMEPGEVQSFTAAEKLEIILGNAGGVHMMLNGKPAKTLGKPGEVVKILIDEKSLQDIQDHTAG